jgi:hypothetical protein
MSRRTLVFAAATLGLLCAADDGFAQSRGYRITLVQGDNESGSDEVPAVLRKPLADAKESLTFRRYRLIDTQMVASSGPASARLRSADHQSYEVFFQSSERGGRLYVDFKVQEAGAPAASSDAMDRMTKAADLERQKADLEQQLAGWRNERSPVLEPKIQNVETKLALLTRSIAVARAVKLLDTRFDMAVGDTVLVGTSPLEGKKALLVFLTASPTSLTAAAATTVK